VEAQAAVYFYARIWGAPTTLGGYVLVGWLLGRQRARAALISSAVMNGVNIILNWLLIYVLGMGAAGAGYATMAASVSAFICGLFLVRHYWDGDPGFALRFLRSGWRNLLGFQANIFVRTFCLVLSFALFTNTSAMFGTVVLAGNTVLIRLLNAVAWFIDGYAFALESLAGKYAGAGDERAVRRSLNLSLVWNTVTVVLFILGFAFFGGQIIGGLTKHQDVIDHGVRYLPWVCICLVFSGFAYIYDGYFIGLAKGKILRNSMVLSTLLGFIPFVSLAVMWQIPVLLWWGMSVFMLLRALTLGYHSRGRAL
jgi:MATE family multidrug resistance protein